MWSSLRIDASSAASMMPRRERANLVVLGILPSMRRQLALGLLALASSGCAHARIDAALERRIAETPPAFGADGSVRFLEFVVDQVVPPQIEAVRDPYDESIVRRELRYRFVLHTSNETIAVLCDVEGSHGTWMTSAQASISCDAEDYHFVVSGSGSTEFFSLGRAHGWTEGPSDLHDPPAGSPPELVNESLGVSGSGRLWNLNRRVRSVHYDEGRWRSECCEEAGVVAAVALDPLRLIFDPSLEGEVRTEAALSVAALLVLRGVPRLDALDAE
jgi:hypothetical protein